jgi:hypothetical protein
MASPSASYVQTLRAEPVVNNEAYSSGVSWPAVIAGAFVTAALWLILLALGTGIGFSAVSPWANSGASSSVVGMGAIVWLILTQLIASSVAGYLAGRLRTKWVSVHTDEVYFRDTAHGFLVWAVGLVIVAAFLTSTATSLVGTRGRERATAAEVSGAVQSEGDVGLNAYFVDTLLRTSSAAGEQNNPSLRREVGIILANALREGNIPPADKRYLAQVVAARSGLSEPDAEKRVDEVFAQSQQAADKARKGFAHAMYWTFLALLIGAFGASFAATIGGKQRDRVVVG